MVHDTSSAKPLFSQELATPSGQDIVRWNALSTNFEHDPGRANRGFAPTSASLRLTARLIFFVSSGTRSFDI
jgi:hypothetical protein